MSRKFNKILALALCSMLLFTAACSGTGSSPAPSTAPSAAPSAAPSEPAPSAAPGGSPAAIGEVAQPAGYPSKPITLIVPVAACPVIDTHMRALVDRIDLGGAEIVV